MKNNEIILLLEKIIELEPLLQSAIDDPAAKFGETRIDGAYGAAFYLNRLRDVLYLHLKRSLDV